MPIKKVGVVGCGIMGSGIATVCAQAGYPVVVREVNSELLNKGLASINKFLARSVEKGKLSSPDRDIIMGRIRGTLSLSDLKDCDLVIEAVIENLELKKTIFNELDKICPGHAILATNTSCLSVVDIAVATGRPDKVIGMHFSNPVPVMKLVEVVKAITTSDETARACQEFGESIGKKTVLAKDTPGFIINRLSSSFMINAVRMLENGVATREDIDHAVMLGLNHPIGPLQLLDLIGLDSFCYGTGAIYEETRDPQYAIPVLMKKMLAAGWLGRKTGKGFYEYD